MQIGPHPLNRQYGNGGNQHRQRMEELGARNIHTGFVNSSYFDARMGNWASTSPHMTSAMSPPIGSADGSVPDGRNGWSTMSASPMTGVTWSGSTARGDVYNLPHPAGVGGGSAVRAFKEETLPSMAWDLPLSQSTPTWSPEVSDPATYEELLTCSSPTSSAASVTEARRNSQGAATRCWMHGCNGRTFSSRGNYRRHCKEKEGRVETHVCPRCGQELSRLAALRVHYEKRRCKVVKYDASGVPSWEPLFPPEAEDPRRQHSVMYRNG